MSSTGAFWKSSIGSKIIMAVTGILLLLFVIGHMIGNLQIFIGPEPLNRYAEFLQGLGELLWVVRIGLLVVFVVHIIVSIKLTLENRKARPVKYKYESTVQATLASRTMIYTGLLVVGFVILHLLHFTMGKLQPEYYHLTDEHQRYDVYSMVIYGFRNGWYSGFYILLMIVLGSHLSHAIRSGLETLGINRPGIQKFGPIVGWAIAIGYIIVPLSVLLGIVTLPAGGN